MLNVVILTTGPLVTLEEAKTHLRVEDSDQDTLIESYTDAAVLSCLNYSDRQLVPQGAEAAFKAASLLMLGDLFSTRETVIKGQAYGVSPVISALLNPYRTFRV